MNEDHKYRYRISWISRVTEDHSGNGDWFPYPMKDILEKEILRLNRDLPTLSHFLSSELIKEGKPVVKNDRLIQYLYGYYDEHGILGRTPYACLVSIKDEASGTVSIGWSCYHSEKETTPFSKKKGRMIAEARAVSSDSIVLTGCFTESQWSNSPFHSGVMVEVDKDRTIPYKIQLELKKFVERSKKYFNVDAVCNYYEEVA